MAVQGLIALALALPTGMLFGVGYGTGVRIGYEQVYPLLFPKATNSTTPNAANVAQNLKNINKIYDTIGGKEASNMGIAMGLNSIRTSTENNPDFLYLEELELKLSGRTPSNLDSRSKSSTESSVPQASSNSDFIGSSLDPNSPNFDAEYYIFVQKERGDNPQTPRTAETEAQLKAAAPPVPIRPATTKEEYNTAYVLGETKILKSILQTKQSYQFVATSSASAKSRAAKTSSIDSRLAGYRQQLQKYYLSFRGFNQLSTANKNHNAQAISTRKWTKV